MTEIAERVDLKKKNFFLNNNVSADSARRPVRESDEFDRI